MEPTPLHLHKNSQPITSVEAWFHLAPPAQGAKQWVDKRSAKELARAFFPVPGAAQLPPELLGLLSVFNKAWRELQTVELSPELGVRFDQFKGQMRKADLAGVATFADGRLAVTVEAKADESFDLLVTEVLAAAYPAHSNKLKRVEALTQALLDVPPQAVLGLRYQLLHAAGATLAYAEQQKCQAGLLLVYEFCSDRCKPKNLARNAADLDAFVAALSGTQGARIPLGVLQGPWRVPGNAYIPAAVPLYIAKIRTNLADR